MRRLVSFIGLASLIGCGYYVHQPGSNRHSIVLEQQAVVLERLRGRPLEDNSVYPKPDALLRLAAFDLLQGMSSDQAFAFLSDDGFECRQLNCQTDVIQHLGWGSIPIARPGYWGYHNSYFITLPQGTIREEADIVATVREVIILLSE